MSPTTSAWAPLEPRLPSSRRVRSLQPDDELVDVLVEPLLSQACDLERRDRLERARQPFARRRHRVADDDRDDLDA